MSKRVSVYSQRSALGCKEVLDEDQASLAEDFAKVDDGKVWDDLLDEIGGGDASTYTAFDDVDNNQNNSMNPNNTANGGDFGSY